MNNHPQDSLAAFVLGALDPDEALEVGAHIEVCAMCRADAEEFRSVVGMLPYASSPYAPPPRVKRQLLARIRASASPPPARAWFPYVRWSPGLGWVNMWNAMTAITLVVTVTLGLMFLDMRRQSALHESMLRFVLAADTIAQPLIAPQEPTTAHGKMLMRPGEMQVMLVVAGLQPLHEGMVYQIWFESSQARIPATTFMVDSHGDAEVLLDAPAALTGYQQVMVTLEPSGGSQEPSSAVVLLGSL